MLDFVRMIRRYFSFLNLASFIPGPDFTKHISRALLGNQHGILELHHFDS